MVVVILVVLWAAVLGPRIVRRLRERGPQGSVDSFYHELHLLDRAAPKTVVAANRLETAYASRSIPGSSGLPSVSSMPGRPSLVLLPPVRSDEKSGAPSPPAPPAPPSRVPTNRTLAARDRAYCLRQRRRRRRDVLLVLLSVVAITGLGGTTHSFRFLWDLTAVAGLALVAYVALAVRAGQAELATAGRSRPPAPRAADPRRRAPASRRVAPAYRGVVDPYGGEGREEPYYGEAYGVGTAAGYDTGYETGYDAGYGYAGAAYGATEESGYGYAPAGFGAGGDVADDRQRLVSARAGYPGAWDEDDDDFEAPPRVAAAAF